MDLNVNLAATGTRPHPVKSSVKNDITYYAAIAFFLKLFNLQE